MKKRKKAPDQAFDFEILPVPVPTFDQLNCNWLNWMTSQILSMPTATLQSKPIYPGLTTQRRVVLDLCFHGYGLSCQIMKQGGELLGIADPTSRYDKLPGATVARLPLGLALDKLQTEAARFDLIVCDVPSGATTPRVGAFAPTPAPLATSGRKLILPGKVIKHPPVMHSIDLALAVGRATELLLSDNGEALIQMHAVSFNNLCKMKEPVLSRVWWVHITRERATLYLAKHHTSTLSITDRLHAHAPEENKIHPFWSSGPTGTTWTPAQKYTFEKLLDCST